MQNLRLLPCWTIPGLENQQPDKEDSKKEQRIRIYAHSPFEVPIIPPCALHTSKAHSIIHSRWNFHIYFGTVFQGTGFRQASSLTPLILGIYGKSSCQNKTYMKTKTRLSYSAQLTVRQRSSRLPHCTSGLKGFTVILVLWPRWWFYAHTNKWLNKREFVPFLGLTLIGRNLIWGRC